VKKNVESRNKIKNINKEKVVSLPNNLNTNQASPIYHPKQRVITKMINIKRPKSRFFHGGSGLKAACTNKKARTSEITAVDAAGPKDSSAGIEKHL